MIYFLLILINRVNLLKIVKKIKNLKKGQEISNDIKFNNLIFNYIWYLMIFNI